MSVSQGLLVSITNIAQALWLLNPIPITVSHAKKDAVCIYFCVYWCVSYLHLLQALKHAQLTISQLQDLVKKLQDHVRELKLQLEETGTLSLLNFIRPHAKAIKALRRQFGVMHYPWLASEWAFYMPCPERPSPGEHFQFIKNAQDWIMCNLFDFVPDKYYEMIQEHSEFGTLVRYLICFLYLLLMICAIVHVWA